MSVLGIVLIVVLVLVFFGGWSGDPRLGGHGYGWGNIGVGVPGILLLIVIVLLLTGRL
jgi:hypothetical protein